MSHSSTIGSEGGPKLAQILCGSPDLGDPVPDAAVPPRATPPYPLDTFGGLRTNFSSINPSDRASVIISRGHYFGLFGGPQFELIAFPFTHRCGIEAETRGHSTALGHTGNTNP